MIKLVKDYDSLKSLLKQADTLISKIDLCLKNDNFENAFSEILELQKKTEQIANKGRSLPLVYANPKIQKKIETNIIINQNLKLKIDISNDFVEMQLPFLLNKKESGSPAFIKNTLYAGLNNAFENAPDNFKKFDEEMVIVFEHCYVNNYLSYRDHDNIDINMIIDILCSFFLKDDSPKKLSHLYFSSFDSDINKTKVYLVKKMDLIKFLERNGYNDR